MTTISTLKTPIRFLVVMIFFMTTLAISQGQVQAQQNGKCLSILEIKELLKKTNDAQTADAISKQGICFQVDDNVMKDINPPAETGKQLQQLRNTVRVYDDLKLELKKCSLEGASSIECHFAVTNFGTSNDKISVRIYGSNVMPASVGHTYISDSNSKRAEFHGISGSNLTENQFEVITETTYDLRLKFDGFDRKSMEISLLSLNLSGINKISGSQSSRVNDTIITWKKIPVIRP